MKDYSSLLALYDIETTIYLVMAVEPRQWEAYWLGRHAMRQVILYGFGCSAHAEFMDKYE
jgi:hypothetical protein